MMMNEVNINSLYEIHNFIDKSVQYIFNKKMINSDFKNRRASVALK